MALIDFFKKIEPSKDKRLLHTAYDAVFTFAFAPDEVTKNGVHIRDAVDLKRTMFQVVIALQLCYLFGTYNIGHQHFKALGMYPDLFQAFHLKLFYGLTKLLPLFIVTNVVGLGIEIFYAAKKGHSVEEGFLVTGALIPLIMPPDLPLWMLALSVAFAVILGKEAFGGTGMNIWNIALLSRVFVFFAYPLEISGDEVWVSGIESTKALSAVDYNWFHLNVLNPIFGWFGGSQFDTASRVLADGFTGATPLSLAYNGGWSAVTEHYSTGQMFWGTIPGSIGETSKPFILFGAIYLLVMKIGSWRIMLSMFIGAAICALLMNAWGATPFMTVPWYYQFYMGSFFFAMAFMATDPVTAASTSRGKLLYGFFIGFVGMIIRVINPAYPEGWMLSILLFNTFAPLFDHSVLQRNMAKRLKSA